MAVKVFLTIFLLFGFLLISPPIFAQTPESEPIYKEEFYKAQVLEILEEGEKEIGEFKNPYQKVKLKILDADQKDQEITIEHGNNFKLTADQKISPGQTVVLLKTTTMMGESPYQIIDKYRLDNIIKLALVFFVLIIAIARWKGLGSILGLLISLLVISNFIIPQIILGKDPVLISIIGSFFIMITTIYLAHGITRQTSVAVLSTFITLCLTGILSVLFVKIAQLSGLGSEAAYGLTLSSDFNFDLKGLLLGGMIIGALGVLDDITTAQSAAIFELKRANFRLSISQLVKRGFNIGKEHISSLVNTLALAYAGVSLPMFIILALNPTNRPFWFLLNMEAISEEIIRTLAGSMGLLLAVPITTLLAAWVASKIKN